eukprot:CAMPEP_0202869518 /NCGR_PEP_ID=MMETSP1391-20130828/12497_1 /ASSEMBLY_ACC=CAM_ASM_000867 /TAXON_ID=1034604 /ORGANISM="Chlamydomonas leiostraca, Strain SAG 11-49" /LENGTH=426 /DNA_ID=CAMNT_0049549845 /DNA_START=24 /DNA_END=1304 /DNA_ORIENTATION=+
MRALGLQAQSRCLDRKQNSSRHSTAQSICNTSGRAPTTTYLSWQQAEDAPSCSGQGVSLAMPRGRKAVCCYATHRAGETSSHVPGTLDLPPHLADFADPRVGPDLTDILPALSPKQLADAIWGFAKQGLQPAQDLMDAIAAEVQSKLEHFRSQDLSNTIWALAVLKYQPSEEWWGAFERQVYNNITDFTDRDMANLMWSLAMLDHKPVWVLGPLLASASDTFPTFSPNALHLVGWACGKLGYCPGPEWLEAYLKASQASFFQLSPTEMSNIVWALAKLGHKLPAKWLDSFLMVAQWRFPSFSAKTLSVVAWAVAALGHTPSQEWLVSFEHQVREKFNDFSGQELACIAWALRRFGYTHEHNAVFYMLQRQDQFLEADYEILANSRLLSTVLAWQSERGYGSSGGGGSDSAAGGAGNRPLGGSPSDN